VKSNPRIPAARRERIRQLVGESGVVSLREVQEELGVSAMTVRRDFATLAEMGLVRRTRGGVVAIDRVVLPYEERQEMERDAKEAIGVLAASLVDDGDTIFLGAGTTCLAVAHALAGRSDVTVITNSMPALDVLMAASGANVIATGGSLNAVGQDMTGPLAEATLSRVRASTAIVGASGISADGVFNSSLARAKIDALMIESAVTTILVADHTKLGRAALALVANLDRIATLVTNELPAQEPGGWIASAGLDLRVASGATGASAVVDGETPKRSQSDAG
jgi:DeoR family fructose operon transcriptional repressor